MRTSGHQPIPVIKCIYLRRRYEVHGDRGPEYDVLSSLLHLRDAPASKGEKGMLAPLSEEAREQAIVKIKQIIPDFDYDGLLAELKDREILKGKFEDTDVGYEKVQIFRIASELGGDDATTSDAAFKKFVNESYHIENEYVMQLNPREFDAVPEHVVQSCSALLS